MVSNDSRVLISAGISNFKFLNKMSSLLFSKNLLYMHLYFISAVLTRYIVKVMRNL